MIENKRREEIIARRAREVRLFESHVQKETRDTFEEKVIVFIDEHPDTTTLEAILHIMEENDYDPEFISEILSDRLKEDLRMEGENLNLLKHDNNHDSNMEIFS